MKSWCLVADLRTHWTLCEKWIARWPPMVQKSFISYDLAALGSLKS